MKNQTKAELYALTAVALWATVATAFKITLRYTPPLYMLLYASIASTIFLLAQLTVTGKINLLKSLDKNMLLRSAILGLLVPFLYYLLLFNAYNLLHAQQALTLNYLWPITLVILSIPILKQKINATEILAVIISFAGAAIIATKGQLNSLTPENPLGVTFAIASAFIWSLYWLYNIKQTQHKTLILFLNFTFGSIYLLITAAVMGKLTLPEPKALMGSIYIGLFEMSVTFLIWLTALKSSEKTAPVANLIYLAPFLSLVCIHYILAEAINPATVIGLILIITGILFHKYSSRIPKLKQQ